MTDISWKTYKELAWPFFREVFIAVDSVCREMHVEYYLIGAQARHFHLFERNIQPVRGTMDIDFAVKLPEVESYNRLKALFMMQGFKETHEPYRLIHISTDTIIDLLPFGEIEEEGTVKFTNRKTELSVSGIKEVTEYATQVDFYGITIKVSPLEGLVILKLISFSERPERRKKVYIKVLMSFILLADYL